jgi:hypothetical protein
MLDSNTTGVPVISPEAIALVQETLARAMDEIGGTDIKSEATKTALQVFSRILGLDPKPVSPSPIQEIPEVDESLTKPKKCVSRRRKSKKQTVKPNIPDEPSPPVEPMDTRTQEDGPGLKNIKKRIKSTFGATPWVKELDKIFGTKIFIDRLKPFLTVPEQKPESFSGTLTAPMNNTLHRIHENCLLCNQVRSQFTEQIGVQSYLELAICHLYSRNVSINIFLRFRDFIKKLETPV